MTITRSIVKNVSRQPTVSIPWILDNNVWNDSGFWVDTKTWKD